MRRRKLLQCEDRSGTEHRGDGPRDVVRRPRIPQHTQKVPVFVSILSLFLSLMSRSNRYGIGWSRSHVRIIVNELFPIRQCLSPPIEHPRGV